MALIDRMNVSNQVFVSTVLAIFARTREIPASAIGELQMTGVLRELFHELGATDDMAAEYTAKTLRRWPPGRRPSMSGSLNAFLGNPVSPGLLHKYGISPEDLVTSWNFDSLDDPSTLEQYSIGASVDCEHHDKWQKNKDKKTARETSRKPVHYASADDELADALGETETADVPEEKSSEIDSLMEL